MASMALVARFIKAYKAWLTVQSGLDFFPDLGGAAKSQLEQAVASELWPRN
jgi:hypothetical protein